MSVLVYAPSTNGKFKKTSFELVSYGKKVAEKIGTNLVVFVVNAHEVDLLYTYGAEKVLSFSNESLQNFNAKIIADLIGQAATQEQSEVVVVDSGADGKYLAPLLAVKLNAGYASNVSDLPSELTPFTVKRKAFSNKAFNHTVISTDVKVLSLAKNAYGIVENPVEGQNVEFSTNLIKGNVQSESIEESTGTVTIADADIVVSGGRGLKGPENWGIIEELAEILGAATACSKPVSDLGWRPHSEHVGQTGKPVASNLYIAIGISGAIQHLAGVNSSKVKVVINTDPEAPFFKAADYGIVGDAFEVVPALIEKLKIFKASNT